MALNLFFLAFAVGALLRLLLYWFKKLSVYGKCFIVKKTISRNYQREMVFCSFCLFYLLMVICGKPAKLFARSSSLGI